MKLAFRIAVVFGIILFFLSQVLLRYNSLSLMTDLDQTIIDLSKNLSTHKQVELLITTSKEYGALQWQYDHSKYYIWGSLFSLIGYIYYLVRRGKK